MLILTSFKKVQNGRIQARAIGISIPAKSENATIIYNILKTIIIDMDVPSIRKERGDLFLLDGLIGLPRYGAVRIYRRGGLLRRALLE